MNNGVLEKGDAIINFIEIRNQYQWALRVDDPVKTQTGFKATFIPIISTNFFETKEEAVADLKKYANEHRLKLSNIIG